MAVLSDGTLAIQAAMAHVLAQWPFLLDMSLSTAIAAIFAPVQGAALGERDVIDTAGNCGLGPSVGLAAEVAALEEAMLKPWLYFNLIMTDSQLFLPVLDRVRICVVFDVALYA